MAKLKLDVVRIEDPCPLDFDELSGSGAVRYCKLCHQNVYDLSEMTADEATELIELSEGRMCVQYYARADGTVVTRDCKPSRLAAARRAARRSLALAGVLFAGLFALVAGLASIFTFWRDEKPEWVVAAKEMATAGAPMIPLPPPPPEPEPEVDHRIRMMRGGLSLRRPVQHGPEIQDPTIPY